MNMLPVNIEPPKPPVAAPKPSPIKKTSESIRSAFSVTRWLFLGIGIFIAWAATFEIEQSVRTMGQVIPSARTQIIQATDGGVLIEIRVQEGQTVKANQLLAVLEKDRANAAYQEVKARVAGFEATLVRTRAEVENLTPVFNSTFDTYPEIVQQQKGLFVQRKKARDEEVAILTRNLDIAKQELSMNETLFDTGDISQVDVMRSQREVTEIQGKIQSVHNRYLSEARQEAAKVQADLESSRYTLNEKRDVLEHTELRSPVAGKVKYLRFNTLGGVLKSGDELMQITPTQSDMIIEAKINPIDIAQLHLGQIANVKLDTFDYTTYGGLDATLVYLSSDTLNEQQEGQQMNTFYRAYLQIKPDEQQINPKLSVAQLKPGMTATADIRTKNRTVLEYIVKPIARAFDGALKQR